MKHRSSDQKKQIGLFSLSSPYQVSQNRLNFFFVPPAAAPVVAIATCC